MYYIWTTFFLPYLQVLTSAIPTPAHMKVNVTKKTEVTPAGAHIPMVGELVISVSKPIILIIKIYIQVDVSE